MLNSLNLKHIFYFWVVAKEASISKASAKLNVSNSSISEQIKILEDRVGVNLFDRSQKRMRLTTSGKTVYETLDEFFPTLEEIFESLVNHKALDVKLIRIGLCPTLSAEIKFKLTFPFIEDSKYTVKALQGENKFLCEAYNQDELDIFFTTNTQISLHGRYEKQEVVHKNFSIVVNREVYESLPQKNKIKALNDIRFINYTTDSDLHFRIHQFLNDNKISPIRIAELDDINLTKKIIRNTNCFGILPTNSVTDEVNSKLLFKVGRPIKSLETKIFAYYKPSIKNERFLSNLEKIPTISSQG